MEKYFLKKNHRVKKLTSIQKLIKENISPGDTIHFATINAAPLRLILQLVKEFCGKEMKLNISMAGVINTTLSLLHCDIVDTVITSFLGEGYPTPGPSPIVLRKFQNGTLKVENWSMLTLPLRLLAGAYNWEWIPTNSLRGSSLMDDLKEKDLIMEIKDSSQILIRKYNPDWVFVHAIATDEEGNLLLPPPRGEDPLLAFSAKKGVLATADYLISREEMQKYPAFVGIPSDYVRGVSICNFGSHPGGIITMGTPFQTYSEDYDFMHDFRKASTDINGLDRWLKRWVFSVRNCEHYKQKLGSNRVMMLMGKAYPDSWKEDLFKYKNSVRGKMNYVERMTLIAAKIIAERIKEKKYKNVLAGIGISGLASWMAKKILEEEGEHVNLVAELGQYDYEPRPTNPFIFNFWNSWSSTIASGIFEGLGIFTQGNNSRSMGVLGAGQVDIYGNINSTMIPGVMYLVGSGGANDVASAADEVIVVIEHQAGRLIEKVPYITAPGNRVTTLITSLGIFEKRAGKFVLTGVILKDGEREEQVVERIKKLTFWKIDKVEKLTHYSFDNEKFLKILRLYDPRKQFLQVEKR